MADATVPTAAWRLRPGMILIYDAIERCRQAEAQLEAICDELTAAQNLLREQTGSYYPLRPEGEAKEDAAHEATRRRGIYCDGADKLCWHRCGARLCAGPRDREGHCW
jgi:hypothetical protein